VAQKNLTEKVRPGQLSKWELIDRLEGRIVMAPSGRLNRVKEGRLIIAGLGAWPLTQYSEPALEAMLANSREEV